MPTKASSYQGANWRDDPLENTPPVRRSESFLKTRGYVNPDLLKVKLELVDRIRLAVERKSLSQAEIVALLARNPWLKGLTQPDFSRMLNANVQSFSVERLMLVLAALDNRVSVSSEPVDEGHGCVVMEREQRLELV